MQLKNIFFTWFIDYDEETEQKLLDLFEDNYKAKLVCFQHETCPTTGRGHWQGYVELPRGVRVSTLQKKLPGIHCEPRRGTPQEAWDYCSKEDTRTPGTVPTTLGKPAPKGQGYRCDLASATSLIEEGKSMRDVALDNPITFVKYHRGLSALKDVLGVNRRSWKPTVKVFWGAPGTGKTRFVYDEHKVDDIYEVSTPRSGSEVWFDGYVGQSVILVDDFYGWLKWSFLLKFIDRYPQKLPIKGGFTENLAQHIYFTSNAPPDNWYTYTPGKIEWTALERRIDDIVHFNALQ